MGFDVSEAIDRAWDRDSTSAVSMLNFLDWAKTIPAKRVTLMTSLDHIFTAGRIRDIQCQNCVNARSGKRACEGREAGRRDAKREL